MKRIISEVSLLLFLLLSVVLVPLQAQEEDTRNIIYICIFDDDTSYIMKVLASEPIGLIFAKETNVIIYSSVDFPLIANVIHIEPDIITGTYRRTGSVATANTTSNISTQGNCDENYSSLVSGFERTILLPVFSDQAIAIHSPEVMLYQDESTAIIGSIGFVTTVIGRESPFPSFQLLRFSGSDSDVVSIQFPELDGETEFYVVSRQLISYTETNHLGDSSRPKLMETRAFFLADLDMQEISLVDDIMATGEFRIFIEFGEVITYNEGYHLNFSRLSSFTSRTFEEGQTIRSIATENFAYSIPADPDEFIGTLDEAQVVGVDDQGHLLVHAVGSTTNVVVMQPWLVEVVPPE